MRNVKRRRHIVWGAIGLACLALIVLAMVPSPVQVDMGTIETGPLRVTLDHEGVTRVRDRFVVSAPVAGRILRIELEPGDEVVAGETVLATFLPNEPVLLDARARAQAEARVEAARAALVQARADRERAAAGSRFAAVELIRVQGLVADGIAAQQALDAAETDATAAAEELAAAEAAVNAARHELEAASAALLEPGDSARGSSTMQLRSPVDGVVLRRLRESEAVVPTGEPLVEVGDPADLEIIADFLSTDAVRMRPGMRVLIERWGGDRPLKGRVRRVEPAGFMKISALGVEEQRVWVVVGFDEPADAYRALGDSYRIECRVVVWEREEVVSVPTGALFRHEGGWAVFSVEEGRARLQPVAIGERNGEVAELVDGLDVGARVVLHPGDDVADGVRVENRQV